MKIEKKLIKELTEYLDEFGLTELEYGEKDIKIKVSKLKSSNKNENFKTSNDVSINKNSILPEVSGTKITSPIIGTAYLSPEPGAKKFVDVGKKIKKGDTLLIVEAMKTMNHVPSPSDGVIKKVCVNDGQPVEFGQTIVILN